MSNSEVETRVRARRVLHAAVFGGFSLAVYYLTARSSAPHAAATELFAGSFFIGLMGLVCWLWPPVALCFLVLVVATLAGAVFGPVGVNWPGAIALLVPCLVPSLIYVGSALLQWLKSEEGGMAG